VSAPLRPGERLVGPDYQPQRGEALNIRVDPLGGPNIRTVRPAPPKPGPRPSAGPGRPNRPATMAAQHTRQAVAARKAWAMATKKAEEGERIRKFLAWIA